MSLDSCGYHGQCPNSNQVAKPHLPTSGHPAIEFPNGFTAVANFLDGLHMSTNLPANFLDGLDRTLACMAKPYMQLSCNAAIELHISFTDVMVRMRV